MNVLKGDRSIPIPIRTQCQRIVDHAGRLRGYVRRNSVYFTILSNSYGSQIIKLIPSLVSCRYREGMTRKHPAVDSYPSSSLSNSYQPIPISSGYFPVYMYLSIDSRRAESRGRCAIPSIHLCGFFFCSRFGLFLQHVWMRLHLFKPSDQWQAHF